MSSGWRATPIEGPGIAELYRKRLLDCRNPDPNQGLRFGMILHSLFAGWFLQFQSDSRPGADVEHFIGETRSRPGGGQHRGRPGIRCRGDLVRYVNSSRPVDDGDSKRPRGPTHRLRWGRRGGARRLDQDSRRHLIATCRRSL